MERGKVEVGRYCLHPSLTAVQVDPFANGFRWRPAHGLGGQLIDDESIFAGVVFKPGAFNIRIREVSAGKELDVEYRHEILFDGNGRDAHREIRLFAIRPGDGITARDVYR